MAGGIISEVSEGSFGFRIDLRPGDILLELNGKPLRDIIDYQILTAEDRFHATILRDNKYIFIKAEKQREEPIGLKFTSSVFDGIKLCKNRCIFCFIDQLPRNLRSSLYLKDDDYRLSFLYGNFITLTNLDESNIERIIKNRLSPLYVSLHSIDPETRKAMLCPKRQDRSLEYLNYLGRNGIQIHIQIVLCPEINDKKVLNDTLEDLRKNFKGVASVGIVPVGLTKYRERLFPLRLHTKSEVKSLIKYIKNYQREIKKERGITWVYLADEFYLAGGEKIPLASTYDDFPQLENGIGLTRLFLDEAKRAMSEFKSGNHFKPVTVITGELAAPVMESIAITLRLRFNVDMRVLKVPNKFLGETITVAGLIGGNDLINVINSRKISGRVLIPDVMLNQDKVFLDDVSLGGVKEKTGISLEVVKSSGYEFARCLSRGG